MKLSHPEEDEILLANEINFDRECKKFTVFGVYSISSKKKKKFIYLLLKYLIFLILISVDPPQKKIFAISLFLKKKFYKIKKS